MDEWNQLLETEFGHQSKRYSPADLLELLLDARRLVADMELSGAMDFYRKYIEKMEES